MTCVSPAWNSSALTLALLVAGASISAGQPSTEAGQTDRVAVLPFVNITGNAVDDWIGVGIAETIAAELDRMTTLIVVRANGGLSTGGNGDAVLATARQLDARWVVSGSYQRLDDQLRLTARLREVRTGESLQSTRVDGVIDDLFALQDQLVAEVRAGLAPGRGRMADAQPRAAETRRVPEPPRTEGLAVPAPPVPPAAPAAPAPAVPPVAAPAPGETGATSSEAAGFAAPVALGRIDGPPPPEAPATINRDAAERATVRAVRLDQPLRIDGVLDEGVYETVPALGDFIQQVPNEGEPSTEPTDAWVFYDNQNIYVSARAWDSAPESEWVANEMKRDSFQLIQNDTFSVALDTFYDRRNGVAFMVNPIGGIYDYQITDEGSPNADWNPIWELQTGRFDGGWTIEMAIPFKSLRFRPGVSQLWGLQFGRRIRHKNEEAYLTPVPISAGPGLFRLSAASTLTGIEVPSGNRIFEVKPYAIGSSATDVNAVPVISNEGDGDFGFDVKYGVTQNLTADFTYNTDFAQVEVDEQQVNLTRFSLFFPEKREFFLEGRGIFDFGRGASLFGGPGGGGRRAGGGGFFGGGDVPTVFFSRRIGLERGQAVPILAGGRLTGKVGDFTIGAVNMQTDDAPSVDAVSTNFTVLRVKRDILRRSRVGGIFTGRSVSTTNPGGSNEVYGLDAAFSFYDNVNFNGYYARSQTPGLEGKDTSYQAAFTYAGDLYRFQVDHLLVGDNFNPEIGFLRRDDFRRTFTQAQYRPRPAGIRAVRQFTFSGSLDYILNGAGQIETRIGQARFNTELENSDQISVDVQGNYELLTVPFDITDDVSIPVGGYDFNDYFVSYSMGPQRRFSGTVSLQRGGFFSGDITAVGYRRGRIEITPQLSVEPGVSVNWIELPEASFTATLATSRVTYTFTPRMFFSGLVQYNSSNSTLGTNLRLRWEFQPGSELFVVYNDQHDTELRGTPILENRAFIVKATRLFRF